jgi:uncharacterized membrane protein
MILATTDSTGYKVLLLIHIILVVVAFGALFAAPVLGRVEGASRTAAAGMVTYIQRFAIPAVILAGIFGFGLIGMSDKTYKFSEAWVGPAILLWLLEIALFFVGILPTQKKLAAGDDSAAKLLPMFTGISHLLLVVLVYLMVFKPGH